MCDFVGDILVTLVWTPTWFGGTCRQTHTHQQQSTQAGVDTLTKSTFVARLVANILTNIVTYIVVDMYPNVARDVYTVFSTCLVTSLSGVDAP